MLKCVHCWPPGRRKLPFWICISDRKTGFELIGELTAHGIPVLVYSMFEDAPSIRKVLTSVPRAMFQARGCRRIDPGS